jgi:hypothetical protein
LFTLILSSLSLFRVKKLLLPARVVMVLTGFQEWVPMACAETVPHPAWKSPRVAFLQDSIVTTDACLMPSSAPYGRAINAVSFQDRIIQTFQGYQYTAWYNISGSTQNVWLARRSVNGSRNGAWEKVDTQSEFINGDEDAWDGHNAITFGICPTDGTLHFAWDHHGNTLRYRRSVVGLCTTHKTAWGANMMNPEQNWLVAARKPVTVVTYPQFSTAPNGGLVMNWRYGSSGNGDEMMRFYNPETGAWNEQVFFIARTGNYNGSKSRNAYVNGLNFGPDGKIHVTWTWREGAGSSNHDICYVYSADNGVTWCNTAGDVLANTSLKQTINLDSPGITIKPLDMRQLLLNQQAQAVDKDGRVHILMLHRREDPGYAYPNITTAAYSTRGTAYYHYFRDPVSGVWSQRCLPPTDYPVGSRPKIGYDVSGNLYAVYLSYNTQADVVAGGLPGKLVVASASKASQYTDWEVVNTMDTIFYGEPVIDQDRLLSDNILSVYIQENSTDKGAVGTPLHVIDFAVNVSSR